MSAMLAKAKRPWRGVLALDAAIDRRLTQPRKRGITMVIDKGIGPAAMADIDAVAAPYIDHWKLAFGTSALMPPQVLADKLAFLRERGVLTYPGGTLLEAAIVQQHCRVFMQRAQELGFSAVEISDGTIDLPRDRRRRIIDCSREAGLVVITEVGKKDPQCQPQAAELAEQALDDLKWGSSWVIVEARESGRGVGIYDKTGELRSSFLEEIADLLGDKTDQLIWEAPQKEQQAALVTRFGANVSLGNVAVNEVLALEALRAGLRFETLATVADREKASGQWDLDIPEPDEGPTTRASARQELRHD